MNLKKYKFILFLKHWISLFVDIKKLISLIYLPKFFWDFYILRKSEIMSVNILDFYPCLSDNLPNTPFDAHYFYQSTWFARELCKFSDLKSKHYDIGSDIKIVGIISAFITTIFIDFRPLNVNISNFSSESGDILNLKYSDNSINSLSTLHVIEHIGLGRYGDPINSSGSIQALKEIQRVLSINGILYLSIPVGRESVHFNAHRVFNTNTIITTLNKLSLLSFSLITDDGKLIEDASNDIANMQSYGCGLFVFKKIIL